MRASSASVTAAKHTVGRVDHEFDRLARQPTVRQVPLPSGPAQGRWIAPSHFPKELSIRPRHLRNVRSRRNPLRRRIPRDAKLRHSLPLAESDSARVPNLTCAQQRSCR